MVQKSTEELLDGGLQLISAVGCTLENQGQCPKGALRLFLTTCIVPHGYLIGTEALQRCTSKQGNILVEVLHEMAQTEDISVVVKVHDGIMFGPLDPNIKMIAFTNLLQTISMLTLSNSQREAVSALIDSVGRQLPEALDRPIIEALKTTSTEALHGGVLHMLVMTDYCGLGFIDPMRFQEIMSTSSDVGCMVFLWECTSIVSRFSRWGPNAQPWQDSLTCVASWYMALEELISEDALSKFPKPVLTLVLMLLGQLWRAKPSESRPVWLDWMLSIESHAYNIDEGDKPVWKAFALVYEGLILKCPSSEKKEAAIIGLCDICPWTSKALQLQLSETEDRSKAAISSIADRPCHKNLSFELSLVSLVERVTHLISDKELGNLVPLAWHCLLSDSMDVLSAAGMLLIIQANGNPTIIRELICRELYHQSYTHRQDGLRRFGNLWLQRKKLGATFEVLCSNSARKSAEEVLIKVSMLIGEAQSNTDMLPPIFGIAAAPVIDLCRDTCFEVATRAKQILYNCLRDDAILFLSVTFNRLGHVVYSAEAQLLTRVWTITQFLPQLPEVYAATVFAFILITVVELKETRVATFVYDTVSRLTLLSSLIPSMPNLSWVPTEEEGCRSVQEKARCDFLNKFMDFEAALTVHSTPAHTDDVTSFSCDMLFSYPCFANICTIFPTQKCPREAALIEEQAHQANILLEPFYHHSKLFMMLLIARHTSSAQASRVRLHIWKTIMSKNREVMLDLYSQMADGDLSDNRWEFFKTLKQRWIPKMHGVLAKIPMETARLWMSIGLDLLPHWNELPFDDMTEEVHVLVVLLTGVNMIMMKHWSQLGIIREALEIYTKAVLQYFRMFKEGGYQHFLLQFVKVYEKCEKFPPIRKAMEYAWGHFYRVHGLEFLVQAMVHLSPLSQVDTFEVSAFTILSLVSSTQGEWYKSHWCRDITWTPPPPTDLVFGIVPLIKMLMCLILYAPVSPSSNHFAAMLDLLIPEIMFPPWCVDQDEICSLLSTMFDSMKPKGFRVNLPKYPYPLRIGFIALFSKASDLDIKTFETYEETIHDTLESILAKVTEMDRSTDLNWMHLFFEQCTLVPELESHVKIVSTCMKAYEADPLWHGWNKMFYSIAHFVKTVPPSTARACKRRVLEGCASALSVPKLSETTQCAIAECLSSCCITSYDAEYNLPMLPNIPITSATSQSEDFSHIAEFHINVVGPLIINLSLQSLSTHNNVVWSWLVEYCIGCINNHVAVHEALLNLHNCILFGHRSLGSCSPAITAVLVLLQRSVTDANKVDLNITELIYQTLILVSTLRPILFVYMLPFMSQLSPTEQQLESLPRSMIWRPLLTCDLCGANTLFERTQVRRQRVIYNVASMGSIALERKASTL